MYDHAIQQLVIILRLRKKQYLWYRRGQYPGDLEYLSVIGDHIKQLARAIRTLRGNA